MSTTAPTAVRPPVKAKPKPACPDCEIETMPNGEGIARIVIPAEVLRRLRTRAGALEVGEHTWINVIKPALYANTF